jgi:TetR/AcrR family transcriptional regulator, regulator of cefoperazone and chloramphenicol sensitivity
VASSLGERAAEDLTARARIRDAALRLFAERGVGGATIRDIAKAAGVSGGLVRHHFGSKDDLRAACDSYALEQLVRIKEQAVLDGQMGDVGFLSAAHPTILLTYRYFARSLVDGSPSAAAMFDEMVELTEAWLARHHRGEMADPRGYAALFVAMETGLLAMHAQLSRALGADIFSPAGHLRMTRAKVDFYSQPLLSPDLAARAHAAIEQLQARQRATAAGPQPAPGRARR